jgi:hypothetical protein
LTNQLQTELENLRQEIAQAYEENSSLTQKMSSLEVASLEAGNNFTLTKQVGLFRIFSRVYVHIQQTWDLG